MTRSLARARLADERVARRLFRGVDAGRTPVRIGDAAGQQAHAAGAAGAALAAVRQVQVLAQRRGKHGLVGVCLELALEGRTWTFMRHYRRRKEGPAPCGTGPFNGRNFSAKRQQVVVVHVFGDGPSLRARRRIRESEVNSEVDAGVDDL